MDERTQRVARGDAQGDYAGFRELVREVGEVRRSREAEVRALPRRLRAVVRALKEAARDRSPEDQIAAVLRQHAGSLLEDTVDTQSGCPVASSERETQGLRAVGFVSKGLTN